MLQNLCLCVCVSYVQCYTRLCIHTSFFSPCSMYQGTQPFCQLTYWHLVWVPILPVNSANLLHARKPCLQHVSGIISDAASCVYRFVTSLPLSPQRKKQSQCYDYLYSMKCKEKQRVWWTVSVTHVHGYSDWCAVKKDDRNREESERVIMMMKKGTLVCVFSLQCEGMIYRVCGVFKMCVMWHGSFTVVTFDGTEYVCGVCFSDCHSKLRRNHFVSTLVCFLIDQVTFSQNKTVPVISACLCVSRCALLWTWLFHSSREERKGKEWGQKL